MTREPTWSEVADLPAGAHLHLDTVCDQPPPRGSELWLAVVRSVAERLADVGGNWNVTLPIGTVAVIPAPLPEASSAFREIDEPEAFEFPAVYRLTDALTPHTWQGEHHIRRVHLTPVVAEVVSYARASDAAPDEPGYRVQVTEEVRAGTR